MTTPPTALVSGVDFVYLPTRNFVAAAEFYEKTGNLTLQVLEAEAFGLEFHPAPNPIALHVDDVEAARARLEAQGVEFQGETMDSGVCHMAFFADPDGNALMLHHRYAPKGVLPES